MQNVRKYTKKFDLESSADLRGYDEILNDSTCTIIREIKEKISEREMGEEGRIVGIKDRLLLVVTYQKASIME